MPEDKYLNINTNINVNATLINIDVNYAGVDNWLLSKGYWDDDGIWNDLKYWED